MIAKDSVVEISDEVVEEGAVVGATGRGIDGRGVVVPRPADTL